MGRRTFLTGRETELKVGVRQYSENRTSLEVTGRIGVGTTNASCDLDVVGNAQFHGEVRDYLNNMGASRVYGGRMGNGPESTGEGFKFRGRGYIQLTGKDNYTAFGKAINEDVISNPDLVSTKYPLLSAAWFFSKNCLKRCVDATDATVTSVTKCVNGGTIGLPDRLKHFKEYYKLLS